MEAIAKQKYLKGSPRKARLVIDLIRGRNVSQALAILKFTNKRAADPIAKCLSSAIANATYVAEQQNIAIDPDDLWIKSCFVDMGPHKNRRRVRPAPQGRAYREQRHYCHITIEVTSDDPVKKTDDKPRKEGKKLTAKKAKAAEDQPKAKVTKHAPEVEAENVGIEEPKQDVPANEAKEKETKPAEKETKAETETAATETENVETETPAEETKAEETAETAAPAEVAETESEETPFENKPFAAQTDEEKSGSDMADDAKIDKVEDLERQ